MVSEVLNNQLPGALSSPMNKTAESGTWVLKHYESHVSLSLQIIILWQSRTQNRFLCLRNLVKWLIDSLAMNIYLNNFLACFFSFPFPLFFFFSVLEIKPRAPHMLGKGSTMELHPQPHGLIPAEHSRLAWTVWSYYPNKTNSNL